MYARTCYTAVREYSLGRGWEIGFIEKSHNLYSGGDPECIWKSRKRPRQRVGTYKSLRTDVFRWCDSGLGRH